MPTSHKTQLAAALTYLDDPYVRRYFTNNQHQILSYLALPNLPVDLDNPKELAIHLWAIFRYIHSPTF